MVKMYNLLHCTPVYFTIIDFNEVDMRIYLPELEDLKVLRPSPDLFNNVKIGPGQLLLIIKHVVLPYMKVAAVLVK